MLIAQITDIHIGFVPADPDEQNMQRLRRVLHHLSHGPNRPDLLLLSGDLTENGDAESYARLAAALEGLPFPIWPMVGNHDDRAELLKAFPHTPAEDGFIQYALEFPSTRLILLDTLEPGRHGGAFCTARAAWLKAKLAERPDTPTLIVVHHPPFETSIPWMDTDAHEPWVERLADTLTGQYQVKGMIAGHLHRTIMSHWHNLPVLVAPSVAPAVALDLNPIDAEKPDGRKLITDEPPAYALHLWDGGEVLSHFEGVGDYATFASFDEKLQPLIRMLLAERPKR